MYDCRVERKEEGYGFLKLSLFPKDIFASRAESNLAEWDKLYAGANANALSHSAAGGRVLSRFASRLDASPAVRKIR